MLTGKWTPMNQDVQKFNLIYDQTKLLSGENEDDLFTRIPSRRRNRVNNEADPTFTAAVAEAVVDLLPTLTAHITDEIRQNKNNEKPKTFSSASTSVEAENWISHIEKIFEVLGCDDQFKARILNTEFTDIAQVANAVRNIEIFRDRPKNKEDNKRDRDGHRIRPSKAPSQRSNPRADDRRDSDNMATVADMATGTYMALTDGVVIDKAVKDMVMVVTGREMVVRRRGVTKISRFGANIIVVLMGHQARADTRIITHVPHVTFVGNFIQERRVTGLLVLALNVEGLGIWQKIVRMELSNNQNYNGNYCPHDSPSYPCCDNCGGSHSTFQCQQTDQNNDSSSLDQIQSPQYPEIHHPSQADVEEVLHDREKFIQDTQTFLEKFNRFSFRFTPRVLTIAWERIDKIKYILTKPEEILELMYKLREDVRNIREELAEYIDSTIWNCPIFFYDEDEEYTIQYREYLEKYPDAVTTILPTEEPEHSLSMGYEHLSTTPKIDLDEVTKSSVKNLVPIPSECEEFSGKLAH
nr:zinc finger, CCHC-type, retrotransposon Gag domain protein [Tanacetum cinerariifolium]